MSTYSKALPDMMELVGTIAEKDHEHLSGRKIAVIMQDEATTRKGGKQVLGWASIPSARLRPILDDDYDFVICFAKDTWDKASAAQRAALVDHELCHCRLDDKCVPYVTDHDYEEFVAVLNRHGLWRQDRAEKAIQSVLNLDLSGSQAKKPVTVGTIK